MDYEKKYKDAMGMAEEIIRYYKKHNRGDETSIEDLEQIFPELKESEDEKIRKALIRFHKSTIDVDGIKGTDILAWIEKQDKVDTVSYEVAENEKREFVGYGFLKCKGDFLSFKEGENYWLEYVGKDNYNVRSDNLLGQTFHITPQQLYTVFRPIAWLEKQGESYTKKDVDDAYLKGICDAKHELEKQGEQKPDDKVEPFDKYEGLTDFERTLADICIGWIGEELGWKQYIKDNADVLLKIAIKKFNSIQDAPFEQKPADKNATTKQEDEIEIPFGAKDSELIEERYYIPEGCYIEVRDGYVAIKKNNEQCHRELCN